MDKMLTYIHRPDVYSNKSQGSGIFWIVETGRASERVLGVTLRESRRPERTIRIKHLVMA